MPDRDPDPAHPGAAVPVLPGRIHRCPRMASIPRRRGTAPGSPCRPRWWSGSHRKGLGRAAAIIPAKDPRSGGPSPGSVRSCVPPGAPLPIRAIIRLGAVMMSALHGNGLFLPDQAYLRQSGFLRTAYDDPGMCAVQQHEDSVAGRLRGSMLVRSGVDARRGSCLRRGGPTIARMAAWSSPSAAAGKGSPVKHLPRLRGRPVQAGGDGRGSLRDRSGPAGLRTADCLENLRGGEPWAGFRPARCWPVSATYAC